MPRRGPPLAGAGAPPSAAKDDTCGFRPMVAAVLDEIAGVFAAAGFEEPRRLARRLVGAAARLTDAEVFAYPERRLDRAQQARIAAIVHRILAREPFSRILGVREFWGLDFLLSADTLDPRPDSETVVEAVLQRLPDRGSPYRLLDLGTGSGSILLALLTEYPQARGVGLDIAAGAARTARRNAERLGLSGRVLFAVGDWARAAAAGFDAVVANPPYIATADLDGLPPEVRQYDPRRALDGGADGLSAYRAIAAELPRVLAPGGVFACEIGMSQAAAVTGILGRAGLRVERVMPDLAGLPRCIVASLGTA